MRLVGNSFRGLLRSRSSIVQSVELIHIFDGTPYRPRVNQQPYQLAMAWPRLVGAIGMSDLFYRFDTRVKIYLTSLYHG